MLSIVQLSMFFVVVVFRDSHIRISHAVSFVNNFFKFILNCFVSTFVSRDSFVRITPVHSKVNTFFSLFSMFLFKNNFARKFQKKEDFSTKSSLVYANLCILIQHLPHYLHLLPLPYMISGVPAVLDKKYFPDLKSAYFPLVQLQVDVCDHT